MGHSTSFAPGFSHRVELNKLSVDSNPGLLAALFTGVIPMALELDGMNYRELVVQQPSDRSRIRSADS